MRSLVAALMAMTAVIAAACAGPAAAAPDPLAGAIQHDYAFTEQQLRAAAGRIAPTAYPTTTDPATGQWTTAGADDWRSGFYPGLAWLLYERTGDAAWQAQAQRWQAGLESRKADATTHDIGFVLFTSFGNAHRLTGDDAYRRLLVTAAGTLATRYDPTVGAVRSWDAVDDRTRYLVIIDNMLNLELLYWAAQHGGDPAWAEMAHSHALTTARNHVRPDGSTFHVVDYDQADGSVVSRGTHQGNTDDSTWARGQAWAIYGFAMSYRYTQDPALLAAARATADYWVGHLPADKVPYWDFAVPAGEPRDTSASAVAAAGLLELATYEPDPTRRRTYLDTARDQLAALSAPGYLAEGTDSAAVLLHGTQNKPAGSADTGLIYGDYYLLEALNRYERISCGGRCPT